MLHRIFITIFIVCFFIGSVVFASISPTITELKTSEYQKRTKGSVLFNHDKHFSEYKIGCGECHHDDEGKALDLVEGNSVDRCIVCHKETSNKTKEEKLSKIEWIKKYHKKAMHTNCQGCHKEFNKSNGLKKGDVGSAPTVCKECHLPKDMN